MTETMHSATIYTQKIAPRQWHAFVLFVYLLLLVSCDVYAQEPADVTILESRFSTTTPMVGEPLTYFLKFDYKEGLNVQPVEHFAENGLTVFETKHLEPQAFEGRVIQQYEYTVTAPVAGQFEFAPASIQFAGPVRDPVAAQAEPVQLTITGVVDVQVVTNSPIMLNETLALSLRVNKRQPVTLAALPYDLQADFLVPPPIEPTLQEDSETPLPTQTPPPPPPPLRFDLDQSQQVTPQQQEDGATVEHYMYTVTVAPQQAGEYVIPAFTIACRTADGAKQQVNVPATSIFVLHPNTGNIDIATDYRYFLLPAIVAALMLLTGIAVFLFLRYRKPRVRRPEIAAPPLPPGELARQELAEIQALRLPSKGEFKRYYTLISETVRKFLGAEFGFPVIERTTEEVLQDIQQRDVPEPVKAQTGQFLREADLVKFAKYLPLLEEADAAMTQAMTIVEQSIAYHATPGITPALNDRGTT